MYKYIQIGGWELCVRICKMSQIEEEDEEEKVEEEDSLYSFKYNTHLQVASSSQVECLCRCCSAPCRLG